MVCQMTSQSLLNSFVECELCIEDRMIKNDSNTLYRRVFTLWKVVNLIIPPKVVQLVDGSS